MNKKQTTRNESSPAGLKPVTATPSQILRQIGAVVVVVTLWSALLVGYLALTEQAEEPTPPPQPTAAKAVSTPEPVAESTGVSFSADVLPIFEGNCQRCHGTTRADAGLSLSSYAGVMAGSRGGAIVTPGSAEISTLVQVLVTGSMPRGASKLSDAEIRIISDWVNAGAADN